MSMHKNDEQNFNTKQVPFCYDHNKAQIYALLISFYTKKKHNELNETPAKSYTNNKKLSLLP